MKIVEFARAMSSVIVVGSCNIDLITYCDAFPKTGETIRGRSFAQGFGGKGANQAVQAARLGVSTAMVGRLGRDGFADTTLANFRAAGIDCTHVTISDGVSSGVASIVVDATGANQIIVVGGANELVSSADVDAARPLLAHARGVVLLCQLEIATATTLHALQVMRGALSVVSSVCCSMMICCVLPRWDESVASPRF